jgi:Tol biopolymer transport system component
MTLNPGDLLRDRYRIIGIIGKGGMGAVYRGEDTVLQTTVAIKENLNPLPQAVKQFKREAVLLASLRHPNLPRVTDHFIEGDLQYLIMDYIPGDDLKTILERQGALPESQVMSWCREICDALTYLHTQHPPVTHRDIKPANIKITPDGKPVLVDFGIAKASEVGGVTTTGARSLTPGFAPPEQYGSSPTDSRSDQYSLSATLYNLLTGHIPPDSLERTLEQTALKPVRDWNPKVSPAVDASIWKAMSLSPSERFLSVKDFFEALSGDVELSDIVPDVTRPAGKEVLTVIRRTPEKATVEKGPPELPGAEARTGGGRIPRLAVMAAAGAFLCLAATGLAVGGYAISGGVWPLESRGTASPDIRTNQGATASAADAVTPLVSAGKNTPTRTLSPTPTASPTATVEPTPNGGAKLLAFVSNRNGNKYQIYTYNLATKEIVQLTDDPSDKGRLAWSPDGGKIYYEAKQHDGKMDIFVMNADGSDPVNLTNVPGYDDLYPAPSPFGNQLAFVSDRNGWTQIYWMSSDGSGAANVSAMHSGTHFNRPQEWDPAWSPDGFTLYLVLNVIGKIRVYRWDTRNPALDPLVVTMVEGDYWEGEPAVSPNGEYLAYTRFYNKGSEICISSTDLSKRKPCTEPLTDRLYNSDADWSPDGQWIAFTSKRAGNSEIYLVMISGSGQTNLTDNPANDLYPAWQPSGADEP